MPILNNDQMRVIKQYIFQNARLLERQLFEYFFGNGTKQACLNALLAYQNPDGGYGNGIEPDILCPQSTGIGAETALFILDLLEIQETTLLEPIVNWINTNQNDEGFIPHPPESLDSYPHQPWWKNPDNERILALTGYLSKLGVTNIEFLEKVRIYYSKTNIPEANYYSYPFFIYLKHCGNNADDNIKLESIISSLPQILEKHADHFPLFTRAWYQAADALDRDIVIDEAQKFVNALQQDGSLDAPYPQLPWWRPIWTLDGLILLKRRGFL